MEDERLACIERELALLKGKKEIKDEYSRDNYQHQLDVKNKIIELDLQNKDLE